MSDATRVLELMDLTSLNDDDTQQSIIAMLDNIDAHIALPAAVCVYPQFVRLCKMELAARGWQKVKVATVTNFPCGEQPLEQVLAQTQQAIDDGADEIDLVMPYNQVVAGDPDTPWQYVHSSKKVCGTLVKLKVIIETGVLEKPELIAQASDIAILAGADFIKTSTGKVSVNATLAAAQVMIERIKINGKSVGFKAAGGVKTVAQGVPYLTLAADIMGDDWVNPSMFRFGASSLLVDVKQVVAQG
ncbi:deoxyribose-phosphate aldolase [Pseudoalteromonas luteoviolacea]|nr:deoxyribose-phosphate aldolase [Pseudoalteromonas luteoviolacea]AOT15230.1 deoxyribose-phosphate aldolase [Pseudoalteromonas luteoviolacea]AOT20144.1 deoxyribose-phosphate aldolase [Pseudoalteromonas luteoviolacea]